MNTSGNTYQPEQPGTPQTLAQEAMGLRRPIRYAAAERVVAATVRMYPETAPAPAVPTVPAMNNLVQYPNYGQPQAGYSEV